MSASAFASSGAVDARREASSSSSSPSSSSSTALSSSFANSAMSSSASQASSAPSSSTRSPQRDFVDRFYGHRLISELSEAVISALFACPLDSSASTATASPCTSSGRPTPRLSEFIAYALHRTRLPEEVIFQALFLLRRLKTRFPAAKGSSGHRLFISALMLASKSSCDDTYSNKSWTIVSQGLFTLREVNQMERELFGYLGFKVNVEPEELEAFTMLLQEGDVESVTDLSGEQYPYATVQEADMVDANDPSMSSPTVDALPYASPAVAVDAYAGHTAHMQPPYTMAPSYHLHPDPAATAAAASAAAAMARRASGYSSVQAHLSPSMASAPASARGSFSAASVSSSVYSATPSPSLASRAGDSSNCSSHESPDTPPSDFDVSPWANEGKPQFGEPAGTYEQQYRFYEHFKQQQQFMPAGFVSKQPSAPQFPSAWPPHYSRPTNYYP